MHQKFCNISRNGLTLTDSIFYLWVLYSALHLCFTSSGFEGVYPYCCVLLCYLFARHLNNRSIVFIGIACLGIWQAGIAIGQNFGWVDSNHRLFDVTGSFGNPGPLGGFLSISIIVSICLWNHLKRKFTAAFIVLIVIQFYALYLSDSRAGWMSVITGVAMLRFLNKKNFSLNFRKVGILLLLVVVILSGMYMYRPHSANGRFLIWKVTLSMIADKPIFGYGINGFSKNYMYYQAQYFNANPDSSLLQYSDNIAYPYNEFLRILVEQGIVGLILILGVLISALMSKTNNNELKAVVCGYLTFAQFSYPSYVPGLLILFPLLIASIQSSSYVVYIPRTYQYIFILFTILLIVYVGREGLFRIKCRQIIPQLFSENQLKESNANHFAETYYHRLLNYPSMADLYGQYVYMKKNSNDAIKVLNDIKNIVPTSEIYCDLGDLYKACNHLQKAKDCYQISHTMVPRRLTPVYKMFDLYREIDDTTSAREYARKALQVPVQIEGTRSIRMKTEMQQYLNLN